MFRKCCVPKCNSTRQDAKLHRFPDRRNSELRNQWLQNINCDSLLRVTSTVVRVFVCHKHFEKRFVISYNRLGRGAYPTLFTDLEISSGSPSSSSHSASVQSDDKYLKQPHCDHTYCARSENFSVAVSDLGLASSQSMTIATSSGNSNISETLNAQEDYDQFESGMDTIMSDGDSAPAVAIELHEPSCQIYSGTAHRFSKKRLVRDIKSLTPKCKLMYEELKKAKSQRNFLGRAKKALKFTKEKAFKKLTKGMNPIAKKFLWMQIKLGIKSKKARRFTMDEKLIGLAIYKQSPKSYDFLKKIFILPSETTLKTMISHINIEAGINPQILELVNEVEHWNDQ